MTVRRLREARGLTQKQLAELSSLHEDYIGGIERGDLNVGVTAIFQLADALGVAASEFVKGIR